MTDEENSTDHDEMIQKVEIRRRELERELAAHGSDQEARLTARFVEDCLQANSMGDGILYAFLNRGKVLFNKSAKEWMVWMGHSWAPDIMDSHLVLVESSVNKTYLEHAGELGAKGQQASIQKQDDLAASYLAQQKAFFKRIKYLRGIAGRKALIDFAHTIEDAVAVDGSKFDLDPWKFACANGVIHLRTGELHPGRPEDLISKASPVEFTGIDTPAPLFEKTLLEIFENKTDLIDFLSRYFGYAMTGLNQERIIPFLLGKGWNGKTLLTGIIMHVFGDHCGPIPAEMLLDQGRIKNSAGPSPDVMMLRGMRLVFASETDQGRKVSPSKTKLLTGSDALTGRWPHDRRPITFLPSHKLCLLTNSEPSVPADDYALWRRICLIPFNLSFIDGPITSSDERPRDKELPEKLKSEASGILAWLVRGCLAYQRYGLALTDELQKSTARYRRRQDSLADFLDECCLTGDPRLTCCAKDLYDCFSTWWEKNVAKRIPSQKTFGNWMGQKFSKDRSGPKGSYAYWGVALPFE
jgi:putative DNA primase/helicase